MKTRREFVRSALAGAAALTVAPVLLKRAGADAPLANNGGGASLVAGGVAPAGTIDWHNHWITPRQLDILKKRTTGPHLEKSADGQFALLSGDGGTTGHLQLSVGFTDIDARLQHIDQTGIQRQVISWATTTGYDALLSPDDAKPLWTAFNEDVSALVKKHPDRFSAYAVVPTSDIAWAARELDRSHSDLGLIGAVLTVGAFQTLEGAKRLTPIFEVAQKHGSHVYLHTGPAAPSVPGQTTLDTPADDAPALRAALERSASFALGALTLTQTGFLDPYPDVTVQIAMLGGSSAFYATWAKLHGGRDKGPDPVALLRRVYFDTGVYGRAPHTTAFADSVFGADRILFGSDFPLAPTDRTTVALQRSTLSVPDKQRIFVANGQALLAAKIKVPSV